MDECKNLIHPFQSDPGTSQSHRLMPDLVIDAPKIDGRTLADLLDYFTKLSRHINFYDKEMGVSDWQPFFNKSVPFVLSSISHFNIGTVKEKFDLYQSLFIKRPNKNSLQLLVFYIYYATIFRINSWHLIVKDSALPFEGILANLVKDRLQDPVLQFIHLANAATREHCIKNIDFSVLLKNDIWNLQSSDLLQVDRNLRARRGRRNRMLGLMEDLADLWPIFTEAVALLATAASESIEDSLFNQKEELKQQHAPQLALLFAFLKLFQHLQSDLNSFTKKHVDFFFKDVLRLSSRPAIADKAHIIFEIQKQLKDYLVKKGVVVKDAKDKLNAEIQFALDDEIVVNQAKVEDVKTLFLNIVPANDKLDRKLLEGVYVAPSAVKADGVSKDFKDTDSKNWPTLGGQSSKFVDVGKSGPQPYPYARLGFVFASPVLLLNEGRRTVTVQLKCEANSNCLKLISDAFVTQTYFTLLQAAMGETFVIVTKDLIALAAKKGIDASTVAALTALLDLLPTDGYCPTEPLRKDRRQLTEQEWNNLFFDNLVLNKPGEVDIIKEIFKGHRVFKIYFSGKAEWIEPSSIELLSITESAGIFTLTIKVRLEVDKAAVTYFNAETLKEDLETTLPVVKIELDNEVKITYHPGAPNKECCFKNCPSEDDQYFSLYHFFRNLTIIKGDQTKIDVEVCGLKNFIVQNDDFLLDVNAPIYPFGTRPNIIDFNVVNPGEIYCVTQQLIDDASGSISNGVENYLVGLIPSGKPYKVGISKKELDDFLDGIPGITNAEKATLEALMTDKNKNYCNLNYTGPSFYIGSEEVFCKSWNKVWINLNWKEKPINFNDYYKAYVKRVQGSVTTYGLNEQDFQFNIAALENGTWQLEQATSPRVIFNPLSNHSNRRLFNDDRTSSFGNLCPYPNPIQQVIEIDSSFFANAQSFKKCRNLSEYKTDSYNGFLRLTLENQDFLHDEYAFVLARQMMALGKFPDAIVEGATYEDEGGTVIVTNNFGLTIFGLKDQIKDSKDLSDAAKTTAENLYNEYNIDAGFSGPPPVPPAPAPASPPPLTDPIDNGERDDNYYRIYNTFRDIILSANKASEVKNTFQTIEDIYQFFNIISGNVELKPLKVLIPYEPWTPIIKNMEIDYTATATITDIELIHLYPFENTHKQEQITLRPSLLPTFCDEGTLYIGLKQLIPGSNVNILFQLAEATANSEANKAVVVWHYLVNNLWKPLRKGFEVLDDQTNELTTSGIVKISIPGNISNDNTILPKDLYWIKAAASENVIAISETIGIHTQAVRATFINTPANDQMRLDAPLDANKLSKLLAPDANVKKVAQPYETFGGRVPESEGYYYIRVSELLRHKGRGIQKFDYERLVLDAFPQIFKVKCINHDFGLNAGIYRLDVNAAPGYVLVAVIPDLNKLKSGQSFEPKVPVSLLEKITDYLRKRTSPFARIRVMNPRYEKIDLFLKVQLVKGKDKVYYKNQLEYDLRLFFAPWAIGGYDKLSFGQCVNRSDVVRFIETRDYVDFIVCMRMTFPEDCENTMIEVNEICPLTPRSILIGGIIDVCIQDPDCEEWKDVADECSRTYEVTSVKCKPAEPPIG